MISKAEQRKTILTAGNDMTGGISGRFSKSRIFLGAIVGLLLLTAVSIRAADKPNTPQTEQKAKQTEQKSTETDQKPKLSLPQDLGKAMIEEAARVRQDLKEQARSLFEREPLGWNLRTIQYLYDGALTLPRKIPEFPEYVMNEGRLMGTVGSLLVLIFLAALIYSLLGQRRALKWIEEKAQPISEHIPQGHYRYFQAGLKVVLSALLPLVLFGLFSLVKVMAGYRAPWFELLGRLLGLWFVGALLFQTLKEALGSDLFPATSRNGKTLFRWSRFALFYVLIVIALFWVVDAFRIRADVLSLLKSLVSLSIVVVLFLMFLRRHAILSLFPHLTYRGYRVFLHFFETFYFPLIVVSFLSALLWCFGYRRLGQMLLAKIWFTAVALLVIILLYYVLSDKLKKWGDKLDSSDESAQLLMRSLKILLLYATVILSMIVVLNLLGLINPLERILSFPIFQVGDVRMSFWILIKAVLILLGFVLASRLLQAYLDYKIYPRVGIDPGLGYALNTFFKYALLVIGILIALRIVGLDLRVLLVFAGAIGIGIGFGLQKMAANIISGFSIIFGGKIRKGDWIETSGNLGIVTDIYLQATRVRTRDNIEYIIPNSDLISNTIVNYTLSSPMVRISLPVGVSYDSDPRTVEKILLDAADREPLVSKYKKPVVRFKEFADSALNFDLYIWIDVRTVPRPKVRSALYFAIFEEFKKAGIEIPFPQRDIHIRKEDEKKMISHRGTETAEVNNNQE